MMFAVGIALFALAILVSVALHECGHMWVARATGMKVRRYFVGFGPTLWSTRRGETEYGLKAVPAGGFCDIAGMTAVEELAPDEFDRAMFKQKTWKRVAVLFAGPAMNFIIGLVLVYAIAVIWGLPNLHAPTTAVIGDTACVAPEVTKGELGTCTGPGPAALAGIRSGDVVVKVGDTPVSTFEEMAVAVRKQHGTTPIVIERDGSTLTTYVDVTPTQRWITDGAGGEAAPSTVGAIGVGAAQFGPTQYGPISAVPATFTFSGDLAVLLGKSLANIPSKVGALMHAIGNPHGQRDPETPISVVGASIIGGDTVDHGLWVAFWFFLAQLNFILGVLNLVPLLPFDGGHIAIALFEKLRNVFRSARGKVAAAPVDYLKLMPATYVVLVVVVGYMLLTVTADLVNPIRLF
ncbi:M50 family metallopeptidase [Mycolicibacter arupensis]|jgi:membrane-associated protease RseP (regulator of RpoE activity)|uniref:Zinc metalloprotease Rip1 n=1 Tax=Mycolicibacter arupensis TaxID=342002 RepID=A0A0F5N006_9MYCO|nr:M50 family metallopeptidase [Mycolicibacter arupensis]KAA1431154.1 site-2 protease family protein [Mycolicibacter arupensis]KKC00389.1 zinc metalloprotease [Mycolicibacter arupensis]MCV7277495.1 site-2 protease family protein [Mycolicibacter arupensis]OQZ98499.1 zinc metalloprotease [Mycolicibacter arupensis]TXI52118.1 MAG: RIP metalloprotease [Mycolicibacter arupensis]